MKKVLWQEMRRTEIEQAVKAGAVVVIPVGSTEQHGNHLPVNTDMDCCFSIAKGAAELVNDFPVLVAPSVCFGYSPHHMKYPGTISLQFHTFIDVLTQVATSIAAHGFKKIFFLNGHGGNSGVIGSMREKLMNEDNLPSCVGYTYWELIDEEMKATSEKDFRIGHAAEIETSLQLYLQPELVDKEAASWAPGVVGDPTYATYEKGKRLFNAAVRAVARYIRDYHSEKLEDALVWRRDLSPDFKTYTAM
ncbi:MAG: creatininase family protein [Dehalococcoidales bacterium]|nr:creatininase family protein [Dehalococcoidales bacterium]